MSLCLLTSYTQPPTPRIKDCRDMAGRPFLRADYRIRCYEDEWNAFTPIVLLVLFGFTAALPTFIGFYLWRNRAELYSTRVYQTVGFLYAACECCVFVFSHAVTSPCYTYFRV